MMKMMVKALVCVLFWSHSIFGANLVAEWLDLANPLLSKYVVKGTKKGIDTTLVDYNGLRNDPNFRKAIYDLARLPSFETLSKDDQIAMWINAYNFLALNFIVENPKVKSIQDIGSLMSSVWKKDAGVVSGQKYSLDQIEKDIITKKFQEPRVHFAINCASLSCPNLANYAYQGSHLDEQLTHQMKEFLKNPTKGMRVLSNKSKIQLSKIFDWYSDQFTPSPKKWIYNQGMLEEGQLSYSVSYMNYDWSLNSVSQ